MKQQSGVVLRTAWFFVVGLGIHFQETHGECFSYLKENIGSLNPDNFTYVQEGSPLHLECTLDSGYAANHSLTAADIFWEDPHFGRLSAEADKRVGMSVVSKYTAALDVSNVTALDDGNYKCVVMVDGVHTRVCSIEVPVSGPPKKYLDFGCESNNLMSMICSWKRPPDDYARLAQTKYTLKYSVLGEPGVQFDCPRLVVDRYGPYRCEWSTFVMKNRPMTLEYTHLITINGTNSFGSQTWTEVVDPRQIVRPAAPIGLTVTTVDSKSCSIKWEAVNLRGNLDMIIEIDVAKVETTKGGAVTPSDASVWRPIAVDLILDGTIRNLDAYANYLVRMRIKPKSSGFWSNYSTTACTTTPDVPSGSVGLINGSYEEVGYGEQRSVIVYWQGIPGHFRNGPGFGYRLIAHTDGGEQRDLGDTEFANYQIAAPAQSTLYVDVIPFNAIGKGQAERIIIPAARDQPLLIDRAWVVRYQSDGRYEVSWQANQPADFFDVFWCPTSLHNHLAKCTYEMHNVTVDGQVYALNLTLDGKSQYRFAVAGRRGDLMSGMHWIARHCSATDLHARLEGLVAVAQDNATIDLSWDTPCQHRFLPISGYRVFYYRCDTTSRKECYITDGLEPAAVAPKNYIDVTNGNRLTVTELRPQSRYCFLLTVLDDVNSTSPLVHKVEQCIRTSAVATPLPLGAILSGSIAASVVVVVVAFIVWRLVKRMRNSFKEIQKQSRAINIPPSSLFDGKYGDQSYTGGMDDSQGHYTRIDCDVGSKAYTHQISKISSSGHGSISGSDPASRVSDDAAADGKDATAGSLLIPVDVETLQKHQNLTCSSADVKLSLENENLALEGQNSSPSVRRSFRTRSFGSAEKLHVLPPDPARVPLLSESGGSGHSSGGISSGYVAAVNLQPSSGQSGSGSSRGANITGDTGYTSHPSLGSSSCSSHQQSGGSDNSKHHSTASSGFGESDSPLQHRRKTELRPLVLKGSQDSSLDSYLGERDGDTSSGLDSTPDSPAITSTTTKLRGATTGPEKAFTMPAGGGYVAWP
ncbi:hypothetical protein BV898_11430 [Hypsibius exemplaris]|uniref:Uncharacterized protein n=1 Tax=Hypsibius exemplaris TaxID=2072580 RepID=A0A1W0WGI6_HYPEX|nr:hypothetical protein BV898_11430 [Hypsibius exemplaris]